MKLLSDEKSNFTSASSGDVFGGNDMYTCGNCRYGQILPAWKFCPVCGTRQKHSKAPKAVRTEEQLTAEDWRLILGLKFPRWFKEYWLIPLQKNGNIPIKAPTFESSGRINAINRVFILQDLPYRFYHVLRDYEYMEGHDFKIFKVVVLQKE
jgi:hypothetical protein